MIGKFRDRIQVNQISKVTDGAGGFTTSAVLIYTLWGDLNLINSETVQLSGRMVRVDNYTFTTRRDPLLQGETPARITSFQFQDVGSGRILEPKEWKVVNGAFIEIKLHYRHES